MPITYHAASRRFHLTDGAVFSRILAIVDEPLGNPSLQDLYYGAALPDAAVPHLSAEVRDSVSFDNYHQLAPYAYPTAGRGDFRPAACAVREQDGSCCPILGYAGHTITAGKPSLSGLPAVYAETPDEADTLTLTLRDEKTGLEVALLFTVMNQHHALLCSARYTNGGSAPLVLEQAASCTLHLPGLHDILHLHGAWAKERRPERLPGSHAGFTLRSSRGASGHEHNPFLALMAPSATEAQGDVWGVSLIWSGSFCMEVAGDARDNQRLVAGLEETDWRLAPGESFQTPETALVFSPQGLNGMSQIYHTLYRQRLCRGPWRDRVRPLLINNWEATYFDFDEEKLLAIARRASELGLELFVLDDGWFGKRDSDNCSLGDWVVNPRKLPHGLTGFANKLHELGLDFGLWLEPEMISPDSDLYRGHPDWCLHMPGRPRTQARNQLILDLSRPDVQQYLIDFISNILSSGAISYIKWDMNRNFSEAGSALLAPADARSLPVRYMLGLYHVLETLTARFPQLLFESCSGGGGRFDPGMLAYMPQTWTSDDTDGVERIGIQWGTSMVYPISAISAHVSAVPNHQVGRVTPMKFRGDVALGGNMGYELDLSAQSEEDLQVIRQQVADVKRFRALVQQGRFTRLQSPFDHRIAAWQFASEDQSEVLICLFQLHASPNAEDVYVRIQDIDSQALYQDDAGQIYAGGVLKHQGLRAPFSSRRAQQDHDSMILYLRRLPQ